MTNSQNMLLQLNIENFLSFKDEATFSFIGNKSTKEHEETNVIPTENYKVLKSAAIYGSNASGKSNLVYAISFMKRVVLESFKNALSEKNGKVPQVSFKLNDKTTNESSFLEVVFIANEIQYRYGFEIKENQIEAEWLYHVPNKIETNLFLRENGKTKINKTQFKEGKGLETKIRDNVLFLSLCSHLNGDVSNSIIEWFKNVRVISGIDDDHYRGYTISKIKKDKKFKNWINKFVQFLEITKLTVEEEFIEKLNIDELEIPEEKKELKIALEAINSLQQKQKTASILKSWHKVYNDLNILVDTVSFDFHSDESKGTKKIIYLLGPIYDSLVKNRVLFIDELDSRLHSVLLINLMNLFHKGNKSKAQFAFVLHDTTVLDTNIFRRDQLYFIEKNQFGASGIYSLAEYKKINVRNDAKFNSNYLKGLYGSVPYINEFDKLVELIYGEEE